MKKLLCALLDILAIGCLAGGYVLQYYAKRKLGMVRWLNFRNRKIVEQMPVDSLKYAAVILALLLVIIAIVGYKKKKEALGKIDGIMTVVMSLMFVAYLGFTAFASVEVISTYYFVMPLMGAATLLLVIRNLIAEGK